MAKYAGAGQVKNIYFESKATKQFHRKNKADYIPINAEMLPR